MNTINIIAENYVKLSLSIGQHSEYYVDAYYGPKAWQDKCEKQPLAQLKIQATTLINKAAELGKIKDKEQRERLVFLRTHLNASLAFIEQLMGKTLDFYSECKALYDAEPPQYDEKHFDKILEKLAALLPNKGTADNNDLNQALNHYRQQFIIPKEKLQQVFQAAISEARRRTLQHIDLPENENFNVELVNNKIWSAYNWYKGDSYSLIQLNTDFPIFIDRAIDLAAHEGYPGHHIFNAQMEKHLVKQRNWVEYSIYNLFGPTSLLAEGSANYGIEVVFPWQERLVFEREVLFPIAGINPDESERYYQIQAVLQQLSYADNMVAQRYCDGEIDEQHATTLLMKYALSSEARSKQRLKFYQHNRSYVITYNYGQDLVKQYLAKQVENDSHAELWRVFGELLAKPKTASMMQL